MADMRIFYRIVFGPAKPNGLGLDIQQRGAENCLMIGVVTTRLLD